MNLVQGFLYNIRGFWLGVRTGKLLFWGLLRFAITIFIMFLLIGLILSYHQDIMKLLWEKPQSIWIIWIWHIVSWIITLLLTGVAAILSYIISQIFFSAMIMDHMSRLTESQRTGKVEEPEKVPFWKLFFFLIRQEIPRALCPLVISLTVMIFGWFIPLGPAIALVTTCIAIIFLAWDNTDLIPARRQLPFRKRFKLLLKTLLFHLGFGLPFLVPGLNILFLSFAPVGATLYYLDHYNRQNANQGDEQ